MCASYWIALYVCEYYRCRCCCHRRRRRRCYCCCRFSFFVCVVHSPFFHMCVQILSMTNRLKYADRLYGMCRELLVVDNVYKRVQFNAISTGLIANWFSIITFHSADSLISVEMMYLRTDCASTDKQFNQPNWCVVTKRTAFSLLSNHLFIITSASQSNRMEMNCDILTDVLSPYSFYYHLQFSKRWRFFELLSSYDKTRTEHFTQMKCRSRQFKSL